MAGTTALRLRARHDAGAAPMPWRRLLLLVGSLGMTTGLTVTGAGLLRIGPLGWLGWTEQVLSPQQVLANGPAAAATVLEVTVPWDRPDFCPQRIAVSFVESTDRVVIRQVRSRVPRVALMVPDCAEEQTRQGRAYGRVALSGPLHNRPVVTGAGQTLAVVRD